MNGRVALGFSARTGSATMVAVAGSSQDCRLVGRGDVDLTEGRVPDQVFHAAAGLSSSAAEAFVERAVETVRTVCATAIRTLRDEVGASDIGVVAADRPVPGSTVRILASHPLMHAAEGDLYRDALLDAAEQAGITPVAVPRSVVDARLRESDLADMVRVLGIQAGVPWRKEHKRAAAVAVLALSSP